MSSLSMGGEKLLRFVLIWGCRCSPGSIQRRVKCRRRRRGESRFNFNVAYLSRCLVSPLVTRASRVELPDFRRGTSHHASRITISHVSQTFHVHVHVNLTVTAHGDSLLRTQFLSPHSRTQLLTSHHSPRP